MRLFSNIRKGSFRFRTTSRQREGGRVFVRVVRGETKREKTSRENVLSHGDGVARRLSKMLLGTPGKRMHRRRLKKKILDFRRTVVPCFIGINYLEHFIAGNLFCTLHAATIQQNIRATVNHQEVMTSWENLFEAYLSTGFILSALQGTGIAA